MNYRDIVPLKKYTKHKTIWSVGYMYWRTMKQTQKDLSEEKQEWIYKLSVNVVWLQTLRCAITSQCGIEVDRVLKYEIDIPSDCDKWANT